MSTAGFIKRGLVMFLSAVVIFGIAVAVIVGSSLSKSAKDIKVLTIDRVDVSRVKDGVYEGWYDGGIGKARVRATVSGGKLTDLTILQHDTGRGAKAESIVNAVVEAQSLAVDTVSGATGSSKVILKAAELALKQGLTE